MPGTTPHATTARSCSVGDAGLVSRVLARLRAHGDREHEMAFNRIGLGSAFLVYLWLGSPEPSLLYALGVYLICGGALFLNLLVDPESRHWRRIVGLFLDMSMAFTALSLGGAMTAGVYPLMLWVIFGNGFRFGIRYLMIAAGFAIVAFAAAIATTPYWHQQPELAGGLLIGLLILPAYAGTLIRKLSQATHDAQEASRAKSYFLASVSHELRTPLNAVIGLGTQLEQAGLARDQREMVGTIVTAGRSLLAMIDQLLEFARVGALSTAPDHKMFDIVTLLDDVRRLMQQEAASKGLRLAVNISPQTPLMLDGDADSIRNVLVNLAGNALKFTAEGSVLIAASSEQKIDGSLWLRLEVIDSGIGISPEATSHIFESFRQADRSIMDRFGGTGLGLAICAGLVERMSGRIGVESTPGSGSTFWFEIPVKVAQESRAGLDASAIILSDDPQLSQRIANAFAGARHQPVMIDDAAKLAALRAAGPGGHRYAVFVDQRFSAEHAECAQLVEQFCGPGNAPILIHPEGETSADLDQLRLAFAAILPTNASFYEMRNALRIGSSPALPGATDSADAVPVAARALDILVADDNRTNRQVFDMLLEKAGHRVTLVDDGEAALDTMENHRFDVVLMDVNMPAVNGIEVTKLYRVAALGRPHLPIVGITADASSETADRCIQAGMDACVTKPVDAQALLALIDRLAGTATDAKPQPVADTLGVVTPLHGRERLRQPDPLDPSVLASLASIGGTEFVAQLVQTYRADSAEMFAALAAAGGKGDAEAFRFAAHALSSTAANVGAIEVASLCKRLQHISSGEFEIKRNDFVARVGVQLDAASAALDAQCAAPPAETVPADNGQRRQSTR